jgi:hypothetical protein
LHAGIARLATAAGECRDLHVQLAAEWLAPTLSPRLDDVALLLVDVA